MGSGSDWHANQNQSAADDNLLLKQLHAGQKKVRADAIWSDAISIATSLFVILMVFFIFSQNVFLWVSYLVILLAVVDIAFILLHRTFYQLRISKPAERPLQCAQTSLTLVDAAIRKHRNVLWREFLPLLLSLFAVFVEFQARLPWSDINLGVLFGILLLLTSMFVAFFYLNKHFALSNLDLQRQKLISLIRDLELNPPPKL